MGAAGDAMGGLPIDELLEDATPLWPQAPLADLEYDTFNVPVLLDGGNGDAKVRVRRERARARTATPRRDSRAPPTPTTPPPLPSCRHPPHQ